MALKPLPTAGAIPRDLLLPLKGRRVLITGAGGFVGAWLTETLMDADVGCEVTWLVRKEPEKVTRTGIAVGDLSEWQSAGGYDYIAHCTTDGVGIEQAMRLLAPGGRMLYLSSGAVYGPIDSPVMEVCPCRPTDAYGLMKLNHEQLLALGENPRAVIARLFSFVGPGLRRHTGKEFLEADPIRVKDDGAVRSYLYASDLTLWLWTILLRGTVGRVYNVGSDQPTCVVDFAQACGKARGVPVEVWRDEPKMWQGTYYVPNTDRARDELGLPVTVGVDEAIRRTLEWQRI